MATKIKPIKKYFRRFGGQWVWQICYSDQVNYASAGRNLFFELLDYWVTCREAKKQQKELNASKEAGNNEKG